MLGNEANVISQANIPQSKLLFAYWLFDGDVSNFWTPIKSEESITSEKQSNINIEKRITSLLKSGFSIEAIHPRNRKKSVLHSKDM